jgi:hypothetical protein
MADLPVVTCRCGSRLRPYNDKSLICRCPDCNREVFFARQVPWWDEVLWAAEQPVAPVRKPLTARLGFSLIDDGPPLPLPGWVGV